MERFEYRAQATCEVTDWDRKPYDSASDGPRLLRVSFKHAFSGDLEGEGTLEYLMALVNDAGTRFVGMERIVGRLGGREGTFILQHEGRHESDVATVNWNVVPGSGTGELRGLRGRGGFTSGHATSYSITLEYDFEEHKSAASAL